MFWWIACILLIVVGVLLFRAGARAMGRKATHIAEEGGPSLSERPRRSARSTAMADGLKITFGDEGGDDGGESIQKGNSIVGVYDDYIVVDIETTGGSPKKDTIIEVAAVRVEGGEVVKKYHTLINPNRPIPEHITKITGISDDMVLNAPDTDGAMPQLLEFIGDSVVVAHNANFDINFISVAAHNVTGSWLTNNFVDTLKLSRALFSEHKGHKLEDMISRFKIGDTVDHRALSDTIQVQKCYEYMKEYIENNGIDTGSVGTSKRARREAALFGTGPALSIDTDLTGEEKSFVVMLVTKCANIDIRFQVGRSSKGAMTISYWLNGDTVGIQIGKIKLGGKARWMCGYGIGNGSPKQRLNGELPDFVRALDEWAVAIERHYSTGIDIWKQQPTNHKED